MTAVDVYANWATFPKPALIGRLQSELLRGKEMFSFTYAEDWLRRDASRAIDPDLSLYEGPQFADGGRNFRAFLDSSPDRWGRVLMKRREAILARREERRPRALTEMACLLGVHDGYRMGGLRFAEPAEPQTFLCNDESLSAPPMARLRELEHAAREIERSDSDDADRWLSMLLAPGSSLGGARPKASVVDENGGLWIAKFPSKHDTRDVAAWEYVLHQLATRAGIRVPEAKLMALRGPQRTFLSKRFDRNGSARIHFSSAMTELGYYDGQHDNASYLELAEFLQRNGSQTREDLTELFRRIVFSISVSNCDDHLRNHGFLLGNEGWELSPAYDMNPAPGGTHLSLNISDVDGRLDLALALEVAPFFQLEHHDAATIVTDVQSAVSTWQTVAADLGIPRREIEDTRAAFRIEP